MKNPPPKIMIAFLNQLASLLNAGLALDKSLEMISNTQTLIKSNIQRIQMNLKQGTPLADAIKKAFPDDSLSYRLIATGEETGQLTKLLQQAARYKKQQWQLKRKIRSALFYPATVLSITFAITLFLLLVIIPQFSSLFESNHVPLPLATKLLLQISTLLTSHFLLISSSTILSLTLFIIGFKKSTALKEKLAKISLKIPLFGKLIQQSILIRCADTLDTCLDAGMPLDQAIQLIEKVSLHPSYQFAWRVVRIKIQQGHNFSSSLKISGLFPHLFIQMISSGEQSGDLAGMAREIATLYQTQLDEFTHNLQQLLEPIVMLILGLLIGGIMLAMYLPIFQLGAAIG